jgi:hypothetical protein
VALNLIDNCTISVNNVVLKFGRTIPISSLLDENFELYVDSATPEKISSPFRDISTITDYNQISRTLNLYWNVILGSGINYKIKVVNLVDATGTPIEPEEVSFTSPIESATPSSLETVVTQINELLVEDKSIRTDVETSYQIIAKNPEFYVKEVSPSNGDFYISNDENDGRVVISFNERPASNFLATKYFKAKGKRFNKHLPDGKTFLLRYQCILGSQMFMLISRLVTPHQYTMLRIKHILKQVINIEL